MTRRPGPLSWIALALALVALGWLSLRALDGIRGKTCELPAGVTEVDGPAQFEDAMRDASTTVGFHAAPVELAELGLAPAYVGTIPLRPPTDGEMVQPESFHRVEVSYAPPDGAVDGPGGLRATVVYGYGRADPEVDAVVVDCGQVAIVEDPRSAALETESLDFAVTGYKLSLLADPAKPAARTYLLAGEGRWFELHLWFEGDPGAPPLPATQEVMPVLVELARSPVNTVARP